LSDHVLTSKTGKPQEETINQRMQTLLLVESELRKQGSPVELSLWAVNELRAVVDYSQCVMFRLNKSGAVRATAISSLSSVDRNVPFVGWVEERVGKVVRNFEKGRGWEIFDLELAGASGTGVSPFRQAIFLPLVDRHGNLFGGMLLARSRPYVESEKVVAARLAEAVSHSFQALIPVRKLRIWNLPKWIAISLAVLFCLAMFIPVPMTTLAPVEVVADDPVIIAAPIDGVIARIVADPNSTVKQGDLLFEFERTELKAKADIARRRELVARARYETARQAAFSDSLVHRQLAIAKQEVALAQAEKRFANNRLERTKVIARQSGQLIYSDRKDWIGKPVKTGERVMEIADSDRVVFQIYLPVSDAITLKSGSRLKVFLDADPLKALAGKLRYASYHATQQPGIGLAFRLTGSIQGSENNASVKPRIGLRGTAQIFGDETYLGFYLFRKPISAVRQYFGI
jgi:multidrug resistance efflux pump